MATYKQCKYCMMRIQEEEMGVFLCAKCTVCVHERCCITTATPSHRASNLKGDYLFTFECRECAYSRSDTFTRMKLSWVQIIHLALYNLTVNETGRQGYFRWKEDICRFIDHNWAYLMPGRDRSPAISGTIAGVLSIHGKLFKSGGHVFHENGWWALHRVAPPMSNPDDYKMFKSNTPSSGSTGHSQKRGSGGYKEVSAAENGTDESVYGRGKRQRNTKEKKKKENVTATPICKSVKVVSSGTSSGRANIHSLNNNNSKNNSIQPKKLTEAKMDPKLEEFCSLTNNIQLVSGNISSHGDTNNNSNISNNKGMELSNLVIKTEPTCLDNFPALDSYDRRLAQENGLFPMDDDNPFAMEYSPEDIADFIPPMFDEKSEFDKIVEEFKEYNAQRENQKELNQKENSQSNKLQPSLLHKNIKTKEDVNITNKLDLLLKVPEVQVETTKETAKASIKNESEKEDKEREDMQEDGVKSVKEGSPHSKTNEIKTLLLSIQDEAVLLSKLNEFEFVLNADPSLRRLRRKLLVRKMKREKGLKIFSLQESCEMYAQKDAPAQNLRLGTEEPVKVEEKLSGPSMPAGESAESNKNLELTKRAYHHPALRDINVLDRFFNISREIQNNYLRKSMYVRLVGHSEETITSRSITSPYTSRVLKPYIRRDFQSLPRKLKLLREIRNHPKNKNNDQNDHCTWPIDYCYVQPHHLPAVNALCSDFFWPGIEMTEALQYPEFSCVVVYRKLVIGFAFMVPDVKYNEAYISFILVHPDWQRACIGTNMMYHLIQTCMGKDITLHVSPTNTSLLFYQKFGFKAETLLLGFYNKYLPEGDATCPHAFVLRLRR